MPNKRSKYGARRTEVDGIVFASAKEARRYGELKLLQRTGLIRDLKLQPRFPLRVNDVLVCTYVADFDYEVTVDGERVVEDVKGFKTDEYRLKAKLFAALHGFPVVET